MKLDKRQIILLIMFVMVLFVLWWLLFGSSAKTSAPVPALKNHQAMDQTKPMTLANANEGDKINLPTVNINGSMPQPQLLAPGQVEYLKYVDAYQLAQVKRMLAEQDAAIEAANVNIVRSRMEAAKLTNTAYMYQGTSASNLQQSTASVAVALDNTQTMIKGHHYKVVFVGNDAGKWTATVMNNGNYLNVVPGSELPDGSIVTAIKAEGITVSLNQETKFIGFDNSGYM